MANKAYFQTKARAIDHLGRGQIADCPTAVTELWKNAHDAYARQISLHIFQDSPPLAAIFDDGCGMTKDDILLKWLTIGTESKVTSDIPVSDRFGLPERPKLGEKGIGRLSAGFLAPVTLLITKKSKSRFTAALVDWRFFENPFLLISDIEIPYQEFDSLDSLPQLVPDLAKEFLANLSGANSQNKDDSVRVRKAWRNFSKQESAEGINPTTESKIKSLDVIGLVSKERLLNWSVARNESDHGTAIFLTGLNRELAVWVEEDENSDEAEARIARDMLKRTLTGFVEPDVARERDFRYSFEVHKAAGGPKIRLTLEDQVTSEYLQTLEHYLCGTVSEEGWFSGNVTAFGSPQGPISFNLNVPGLINNSGRSRVGPFRIEAATIEQNRDSSSHADSDQDAIKKLQEEAGGMMVYRDGVRVLPYGRPDSDFFELEDRRGRHAGREFWAHKRVFGRVFLSRLENPNLKDKAGREGLVENEAKRLLKLLVIAVLMESARRFFGSDSPIRETEIARIREKYAKGKESKDAARKIKRKDFMVNLRNAKKAVLKAEETLVEMDAHCVKAIKSNDNTILTSALEEVGKLRFELEFAVLNLSQLPKGLEDREEQYRETRDRIEDVFKRTDELESTMASKLASLKASEPDAVVEEFRQKHLQVFCKQARKIQDKLTFCLGQLAHIWETQLTQAKKELDEVTLGFVQHVDKSESVPSALGEIRAEIDRISIQALDECRSVVRAIEMLAEGIDLDGALTVSDEGEMSANERIQQLSLLAQSGIAVELISHELEELSSETEYNLMRLPEAVRKTAHFKRAYSAFSGLVDRFRFLTPLSVATYRARREIKGKEITDFVLDFFSRRFKSSGVDFASSTEFDSIHFRDIPSRIFPVFINLVNNSLFWLKFSKAKKEIRFGFRDGLVLVADSGPGIDLDDIDNLFQMFFTKRPEGRGIGLYLCKANLAVARHSIRYALPTDPKILPGANFIIEFRGING